MTGTVYAMKYKKGGTLSAFKYRLNIDKPSPNKLYLFGDRKTQIIHARLRNKCSRLNEPLYLKNIVQSPFCICDSVESTYHYFIECLFYRELRTSLNEDIISSVTRVTLHVILYGDEDLNQSDNEKIFAAIHTYISRSRRFTYRRFTSYNFGIFLSLIKNYQLPKLQST